MAKAKYDWEWMKAEFLWWEWLEVTDYLRYKFGANEYQRDWNISVQTQWWASEKKQMIELAQKNALAKAQKELEKRYKPDMKQLWEMHKMTILLAQAWLQYLAKESIEDWKAVKMPDMYNVEKIWKMVKVEKEEPTEINKEYQITEEDQKMIEDVLNDNL